MSEGGGKLWGGRFRTTDAFVERFTSSFDQRLTPRYRRLSARTMLAEQGVLTEGGTQSSLVSMRSPAPSRRHLPWAIELEDVHMNIEGWLTDIGAAGKSCTRRSRNDQVATDIRLWLRMPLMG